MYRKHLRRDHFKEMEFAKDFLEASSNKKSNVKLHIKRFTSTMEFFLSTANIVKKLPQDEQERIEALVLDMIREAEIRYQRELQNKPSKENNNGETQTIGISKDLDEDEFVRRVKFETGDNEILLQGDITETSSNSCFSSDTQKDMITSEQYVVKVIPESESSEVHEEYIIKLLPDNEAIMSDTKAIIKSDPDAKKVLQIKDEIDEINNA